MIRCKYFLTVIVFVHLQGLVIAQSITNPDNNSATNLTETIHVVTSSQTLFGISKLYDVTVNDLKKWNGLDSDKIYIGQRIKVKIQKSITDQASYNEADSSEMLGYNREIIDKHPEPEHLKKIEEDSSSIRIQPSIALPVSTEQEGMIINFSGKEIRIIPKVYDAKFLTGEIEIDGIPSEQAWIFATVADDFMQLDPQEGAPASQRTEVRLLYDHNALYISATMYDSAPDSILHELGNRDEGGNLNSDGFRLGLDPYNRRETGYVFEVSASGVQTESFNEDYTFDAVWQSAVKLNSNGWTAEMKIPYSAIRFPVSPVQRWGVQFARTIRRNREYQQWTLTPKSLNNRMLYWGTMEGIKDIDPPLRLSLTPYFSVYGERSPAYNPEGYVYQNSSSYSGGADLKYGIDERFTLDMTLLPDFSQVQSDNKVKNLSAFETIYEEKRQFFMEGTDLFEKGNLFYSRRIGRTPKYFYSVSDSLNEGESIKSNPDKARLINATKISGRTDGGLGIGLLNAITANTYATVHDAAGNRRKILTEPATNYNVLIFDQQLKNNSNIFIANTNVLREGSERDANVTTAQGRFENKKHTYQVAASYSESNIFERVMGEDGLPFKERIKGNVKSVSASKIKGNTRFGGRYEVISERYDKNDLGYNFVTDNTHLHTYITYYKFNPFWKHFKYGSLSLYTNRSGRLSNGNELKGLDLTTSLFLLLNSNFSIYTETGMVPLTGRDYYEPRIPGVYYLTPKTTYGAVNFTTNYNKRLAFDFGGRFNHAPSISNTALGYYIIPMVRISDKFNVKFSHFYDVYRNDLGFAYLNAGADTSFFGQRDIVTIVNTLTTRYIFKNDMSLSLIARQYWSNGDYEQIFRLQNDGSLAFETSDADAYNFNSTYLTTDLVYNWQFAPGSFFLLTYKNLIFSESLREERGFFSNLSQTISDPQTNSISLKVLYYLDYRYFVK